MPTDADMFSSEVDPDLPADQQNRITFREPLTPELFAEMRERILADHGVGQAPTLYPDRNVMHRNMGPAESFPCCSGRGITWETAPGTEDDYVPDAYEVYCSCAAGVERRRVEAGTP